jgi:protein phosphatase PTC7
VSQLEDFGMDPSELPQELLRVSEELAVAQLHPDNLADLKDAYKGPIALLREAYLNTSSMGSTTVLLAALDNSTRIHGKLHPMIAVLTIGDCELMLLRRGQPTARLDPVFHTEMQRIDQNSQTPLQLARVDERLDASFEERIALEVIEEGSAVHCVSVYQGDIVIMGSDGIFDNLFLDEIVTICNEFILPPSTDEHTPLPEYVLGQVAQRLVKEAHLKPDESRDAPIGRGGKIDDTSVIVAEVTPWTDHHRELCKKVGNRGRQPRKTKWLGICSADGEENEEGFCSRRERTTSDSDSDSSEEDAGRVGCTVA